MNQNTAKDPAAKAPRKSNVEIITDLMEFSNFGALAQVFVMDALSKQAHHVVNATPEELAEMGGGIIPPDVWQGVAKEISEKLEANSAF